MFIIRHKYNKPNELDLEKSKKRFDLAYPHGNKNKFFEILSHSLLLTS